VHDQESPQQKAIRLLNRQLGQLQTIRGLNYKHAEFKAWRDATMSILERSLGPTSQHTIRFRDTRFFGPISRRPFGSRVPPEDHISPKHAVAFQGAARRPRRRSRPPLMKSRSSESTPERPSLRQRAEGEAAA
jgi:hypothetical protein